MMKLFCWYHMHATPFVDMSWCALCTHKTSRCWKSLELFYTSYFFIQSCLTRTPLEFVMFQTILHARENKTKRAYIPLIAGFIVMKIMHLFSQSVCLWLVFLTVQDVQMCPVLLTFIQVSFQTVCLPLKSLIFCLNCVFFSIHLMFYSRFITHWRCLYKCQHPCQCLL